MCSSHGVPKWKRFMGPLGPSLNKQNLFQGFECSNLYLLVLHKKCFKPVDKRFGKTVEPECFTSSNILDKKKLSSCTFLSKF